LFTVFKSKSSTVLITMCTLKEFKLGEHVEGLRIDAEIALRMRLDGYAINKSINIIYCEREWVALKTSPEDSLEYVKRIAHVSFGTVGILTIAQRKAEEEMTKRNISR